MESTRTTTDVVVSQAGYTLRASAGSPWVRLEDGDGPWADLCLIANADHVAARDETFALDGPDVEGLLEPGGRARLHWRLSSSGWAEKHLTIDCDRSGLAVRLVVSGEGRLGDVTLLGGQATLAVGRSGSFWSRRTFPTILPAAPGDPTRVVLHAEASADSTASGGSEPGRPGWFFTPAPFWVGATREGITDPLTPPAGRWLGFGLESRPGEQGFLGFGYRGGDNAFRFVLDYQGQTHVSGSWTSPAIRITPGADPYALLATYREGLVDAGSIPNVGDALDPPRWWREPMFCGWGAQCAAAAAAGRPLTAAPEYSRQERYDGWLERLENHGIIPGTIVIDDGWAAQYGLPEPHRARWPDLRGWIRDRQARGQRVLLWWKAWDTTGLPSDVCVRTPDGGPLSVDPNHPEARRWVTDGVTAMLAASGLGADGLKIDFTARTPNGASLVHRPGDWGIGLLRRLLTDVRDAAKAARRDALLIGQVPEPTLAPLVDMIRLNDALRLDDPAPTVSIVPHMRHRAEVVRAACPDHLIDTDDWCMPDLATWREYAEEKPAFGVPSLYYADRLDLSGERLTDAEYDLVRRTWAAYREREGLPAR